eukprot:scaffold397671_cov11-Prasinocladus_malaysianus.AAC.1
MNGAKKGCRRRGRRTTGRPGCKSLRRQHALALLVLVRVPTNSDRFPDYSYEYPGRTGAGASGQGPSTSLRIRTCSYFLS